MKSGKHQRSKQRCQDLCWNVHHCAESCFAFVNYARVAQSKHFYWLVPRSLLNNSCVLCRVKAKKREQKHTTGNRVEFHSHSPLLTKIQRCRIQSRSTDLHAVLLVETLAFLCCINRHHFAMIFWFNCFHKDGN